jgi:hypothetical protein
MTLDSHVVTAQVTTQPRGTRAGGVDILEVATLHC